MNVIDLLQASMTVIDKLQKEKSQLVEQRQQLLLGIYLGSGRTPEQLYQNHYGGGGLASPDDAYYVQDAIRNYLAEQQLNSVQKADPFPDYNNKAPEKYHQDQPELKSESKIPTPYDKGEPVISDNSSKDEFS